MKHYSRGAWKTLNKLIGQTKTMSSPTEISADSIARCLVNNGKFKDHNRIFRHYVKVKLNKPWKTQYPVGEKDVDLRTNFNEEELKTAGQTMKPGKAPGPDNLHPEFVYASALKRINDFLAALTYIL